MQVVTPELIKDKKVLLRMDLDVSIEDGKVIEEYRLVAGMPTLELCLEYGRSVIILGHIGRPEGKKVEELSVAPIYRWLIDHGFGNEFDRGKLSLLENLRFEKGEEEADIYFAKELAALGNFYVNEAFASHHPAASTTILPLLLPHSAGLQFEREVREFREVRENPKKPLVVIIGGVKVEDKLPAVLALAKIADTVLVGGKIVDDGRLKMEDGKNILVADLTEDGEDITPETVGKWEPIIREAKMILWNGPLGKIDDPKNNQTEKIAQLVIESEAKSIVGGGDTVGFLGKLGLLGRFWFVSTGGGAMLEFLAKGTLPTIEALK